eukprot:GEZU01001014.1.p1 GENE.GEZU01001014.1~~GEZU01001014.1.p1  ORF type:complete len:458 (+),score=126.66 GEZU01001014.1:739-2112(+)
MCFFVTQHEGISLSQRADSTTKQNGTPKHIMHRRFSLCLSNPLRIATSSFRLITIIRSFASVVPHRENQRTSFLPSDHLISCITLPSSRSPPQQKQLFHSNTRIISSYFNSNNNNSNMSESILKYMKKPMGVLGAKAEAENNKKAESKKMKRDQLEEEEQEEKPSTEAESTKTKLRTPAKRARKPVGTSKTTDDDGDGEEHEEYASAAVEEPKKAEEDHEESSVSAEIPFENFEKNLDPSWRKVLGDELKKPYFKKLKKFLIKEQEEGAIIYPPVEDIFNAFKYCTFDNVKVVIIGQDPYHGAGQAHGLCFSVLGKTKPPPSLVNIFKELQTDIPGFKIPQSGDLSKWAKQGVLLLNTVLTVRQASANSHAGQGWEQFTDAVIQLLNDKKKGLVFLLWGKPAQTKAKKVSKTKHHILTTVHPSPLSASKGWFGSKHFSKCNELLRKEGKEEIDWKLC